MSTTPTLPQQTTEAYLMPTYIRQQVAFVRGEGSWLYTKHADGSEDKYLDALTGIAVCGLGHAHPQISAALAEQATTLLHTSNLYRIPWQEKAGEMLCKAAGMEKVFFSNSGAEANEAALKLARLHAYKQGMKQPKIIVMEKSFHGRTLLTLSATGNQKVRDGFYALDDDFIRVPFGDVAAIKQAAAEHDEICAIFLEPIQGEGGINVADTGLDFLVEIDALCNQHNWLFMLDEIQTGNGRTGTYFAYQHTSVKPDVLSTAKGLGNGFPVGACMVAGKAANLFQAGNHGSTYGGTPMQCRAVCATYEALDADNALENATDMGNYLKAQFAETLAGKITEIRGMGMMIGIELPEKPDANYGELVHRARDEQNLLINVTAGNVVRLLPPLNLSKADADTLVTRLTALLMDVLS